MCRRAPLWQAPGRAQTLAAKFVLPSPASLGVSADLNLPQARRRLPPLIGAPFRRMERVGVLRYKKDPISAAAVRVTITLATNDPTLGQPVSAEATTEAAAVLMALDAAEAWSRRK